MEFQAANADELIAAIREANAKVGEAHTIHLNGKDEDYVVFVPTGEYFGATAFPVITADITIQGNRHTIVRSVRSRPFRFFAVVRHGEQTSARLVLNQLTLGFGDSSHMGGGAVVNDGLLVVNECVFRENEGSHGGAIYAGDGGLTSVETSVFIHNLARENGGGIFGASSCQLKVRTSVFYENYAPEGDSAIFESSPDTVQINGCVTWNGNSVKIVQSDDNGVSQTERLEIPPVLELLKRNFSESKYLVELRKVAPKRDYDDWLPPPSWWAELIPLDTGNSLVEIASHENRIPTLKIERQIFGKEYEKLFETAILASANRKIFNQAANTMSGTYRFIQERLAVTPGIESLEAMLRLMSIDMFLPTATFATLVASFQSIESINALFERQAQTIWAQTQVSWANSSGPAELKFLIELVQELVVRGYQVNSAPAVAQFIRQVKSTGNIHNRLSQLPLKLLDIEREIINYIPIYRSQGNGLGKQYSHPWGQGDDYVLMPVVEPSPIPNHQEITSPQEFQQLGEFLSEMESKVEARRFRLDQPLNLTEATLLSFNLSCLQGATEMRFRSATPEFIMSILFAAACNGGPYSQGAGPAYGRLMVWQSLRVFVGGTEEMRVEKVAELASSCQWYYFWAVSDWFYNAGYDIGIAVLQPDGRTLTIVAASATD